MKNKIISLLVIFIIIANVFMCTQTYAAELPLITLIKQIYNVDLSNGSFSREFLCEDTTPEALTRDYYHLDDQYDYVFNGGTQAISYQWLRKLKEFVSKINSSSVSYRTIARQYDGDDIKLMINVIRIARGEIPTFVYGPDSITYPGHGNHSTHPKRAISAYEKIIGHRLDTNAPESDSFFKKVTDVMQELQAAYDYKTWTSGASGGVAIHDDYNEKFKYTFSEIQAYLNYYGKRYNLQDEQKNIIEKLWDAKQQAYRTYTDYSTAATRSNLRFDKSDSYANKMGYDKDKIWLYLRVFGRNNMGNLTTKQKNLVYLEWASILANGTHTNFYQGHTRNGGAFDNSEDYQYSQRELDAAIAVLDGDLSAYQEGEGTDAASDAYDDALEEQYDGLEHDNTNYEHPKLGDNSDDPFDADNTIQGAEDFLEQGTEEKIGISEIQSVLNPMYSIALTFGIIIAVIVGALLGIKFMTGSVEQKAETKKLLIPYVVGCVVVFGAFVIWKIAITVLAEI